MHHSRGEGWPHRRYAGFRATAARHRRAGYRGIRPPDGTAVSRYSGLPAPPKAGSRRALSTGLCIFLLTAGAVFWLALPAGSHWGINLNVVGIVVVCAGLLSLVLPRLPGLPAHADWLRRWVIP